MVTLGDFPHIRTLGNGIFFAIAMGYDRRDVALSNLLGKYLARIALGEETNMGVMSLMTENSVMAVPFPYYPYSP
jgi:hypothetical protein